MMDHLARFAVLLPVRDKAVEIVARVIIERIIGNSAHQKPRNQIKAPNSKKK